MASIEAFCDFPFQKIKVSPNGDVRLCCYQRGALGNLLKDDFSKIWSNRLAEEIRSWTKNSQLHPVCQGWGACPYLVRPKLRHNIQWNPAFPTYLEFDLPSSHCNVGGTRPTPETACFMCPRAAQNFRPQPDLSYELIERLKFLMPHLTQIHIQGTAEPFWKDRVFELLMKLEFEKHNQKCVFTTYTNGTVFNERCRRQFIELCPRAALFFSLDAATPQTYVKIRRLNIFRRVLNNIRNFIRERRPTQRVEIANNLNLVNLHEAVQMVELGKELGVDGILFNPTHDGGTNRPDLDPVRVGASNAHLFAEAQKAIQRRASELGLQIKIIRPLDLNLTENPGMTPPRQDALSTIVPATTTPL